MSARGLHPANGPQTELLLLHLLVGLVEVAGQLAKTLNQASHLGSRESRVHIVESYGDGRHARARASSEPTGDDVNTHTYRALNLDGFYVPSLMAKAKSVSFTSVNIYTPSIKKLVYSLLCPRFSLYTCSLYMKPATWLIHAGKQLLRRQHQKPIHLPTTP